MNYFILFIILSVSQWSMGAKILILHPMYAASHVLTLRSLAKELANDGHEVDIYRWKDGHKYPEITTFGITDTVLAVNNSDGNLPMFTKEERAEFVMPLSVMWEKGTNIYALPLEGFLAVRGFCDSLLKNNVLHNKLSERKYDIAIVDLIYNECSLGLAHHLNLPVIGYWAFTFAGGEPQYTTSVFFPTITPMLLSHYTNNMNFFQRLHNQILSILSHLVMQVEFYITSTELNKYLPDVPHPKVLLKNLSGILLNSHSAIDYPRHLPPSFIEVGGMQLKPSASGLPKDIARLMDEAKDGVILFTMGFIFDFNFVPAKVTENFMNAFRQLKEIIIIKSVGTPPGNVPENVKIFSWVPQQDILGHKNLKLFMTHCGMHGVIESLYYGVPMVGIPVFVDQKDVAVRLVEKGVVVEIQKEDDSETIFKAIQEVLQNQKYKKNAEFLSKILKDEPCPPIQRAKWLINHTIMTKGAEHLKLSTKNLNVFQLYGIDLLIFVILCNFILYKFFKFIFTNKKSKKILVEMKKKNA